MNRPSVDESAASLASELTDQQPERSAGFQVHVLKTHPKPFAAVRARIKKLEIRWDDRGYSVGDTLWLEEFDPDAQSRSGEVEVRVVTHILAGGQYGIAPGYVAMSIDDAPLSIEGRPDLMSVREWLEALPALDMDDIVADGGVTVAMVVQQEAREMAARLTRSLAAITKAELGDQSGCEATDAAQVEGRGPGREQ